MKKILFTMLLMLSFNAYSALTFPTNITVTGISSTNSLAAAIANRTAIQAAVNSCVDPLGCTVRITDKDAFVAAAAQVYANGEVNPDGTPKSDPSECVLSSQRGVSVPSNVRVSLERSYLKVFPNKCQSYSIFRFWGVHDSELRGGGTSAIIGDKKVHNYTYTGQPCSSVGATHECGHLVSVTDSQNIVVSDITLTLATGDGLYLGGDNSLSNNIAVNYVKSNNNRRQGISVISGSNVTIEKNWIINTGSLGTPDSYVAPGLGIDVEPNGCNQRIVNLVIKNNYIGNNWGGGFKAYSPVCANDRNITTDDVYQNVSLTHNTFNEFSKPMAFSNAMNIVAEFNNISTQTTDAFYFIGAADNIVRRNTIEKTGALGGYLVSVGTQRPNIGNIVQNNIYHNFANPIWPTNTPLTQVDMNANMSTQ